MRIGYISSNILYLCDKIHLKLNIFREKIKYSYILVWEKETKRENLGQNKFKRRQNPRTDGGFQANLWKLNGLGFYE